MGIFSALQKAVAKPIVATGNLITKGIEKVTGKTYGRTTEKEFLSSKVGKVTTAGIVATAGALAVASAPAIVGSASVRATAGKVATSVITNPAGAVKSVVVGTAVAGVIAGGGLALLPKIYEGTKAGAEVLTGEKELSAENISGVAKVVGIGLGVAGLGAVAGYVAGKFFGKDTETLELPKEKAIATDEAKPITPETTTIQTGKRKRRKAKAVISPSVRQSVRVNVISNNSAHRITKNYLRERILN